MSLQVEFPWQTQFTLPDFFSMAFHACPKCVWRRSSSRTSWMLSLISLNLKIFCRSFALWGEVCWGWEHVVRSTCRPNSRPHVLSHRSARRQTRTRNHEHTHARTHTRRWEITRARTHARCADACATKSCGAPPGVFGLHFLGGLVKTSSPLVWVGWGGDLAESRRKKCLEEFVF